MASEPKKEGEAVPIVESVVTLAHIQSLADRIEDLERENKHLKKSVDFVSANNRYILTVQYVAFIGIIVALAVAVIAFIIKK